MIPTNQQKLIIDYENNAVVIAAPGSGKTFVLSQKIKNNLKVLLEHQGVIAISYTNKASYELRTRSLSNGENPKSSFFGTIDKFSLSEIVVPFGKHIFGIPKKEIKITKISSLPADEKDSIGWFNRNLKLNEVTEANLSQLKDYFLKGIIFIETIGLLAHYIYEQSSACRKYIKSRYRYIYIDEYQDSGQEQHEIFLKITGQNIIGIVVGDLNQSIFAFSGKDAKYLDELTHNTNFKYFKLDKNHRCHPSIINYSNYLLNPRTELIPTEDKQVLFLRINGNEQSIAEWIDQEIERIKNVFRVENLSQIAILTRGNRTGEILDTALKTPHRLFLSTELDNNLNIWSSIFTNLLYFFFDHSFKFIDVIEVFTSYDKFNAEQLKSLNHHRKLLEVLMLTEPFDYTSLKPIFINIARIIAPNLENNESVELLEAVLNSPRELNSYKPTSVNELNILTLHKSKGLEFEVVIHLDLYEWVFPTKQPHPHDGFDNPIYADWKQDINLHYVGLTRAKKGCILISSNRRTNNQKETKNATDSEFLSINDIQKLRLTA